VQRWNNQQRRTGAAIPRKRKSTPTDPPVRRLSIGLLGSPLSKATAAARTVRRDSAHTGCEEIQRFSEVLSPALRGVGRGAATPPHPERRTRFGRSITDAATSRLSVRAYRPPFATRAHTQPEESARLPRHSRVSAVRGRACPQRIRARDHDVRRPAARSSRYE
jgi:hypothetical protein